MSYRTYQKRTAALAFAAALAGSAVLMAAPVAEASVVNVNYQCKTPIGDKSAVSPIDIKSVKSGNGYKLTMSWQKEQLVQPGGARQGRDEPERRDQGGRRGQRHGGRERPRQRGRDPRQHPHQNRDLSGTYTPRTSKVTFTAGVLTIKALGTTTTCTPTNNPGPSLTLDVTAAGGGSGSGGSSGSSSSAADRHRLRRPAPQTGPHQLGDHPGTFGGTVLLAGAAGTLWLTRRHQTTRR